ncbi:hypothetical protein [Streptomyces sp. NPDC088350]|uniref:hypothetical protein n=1 Tax=Streptomyces sp. NPDC088350 TaxID=3365854 RepID=UPI0037F7A4FF
MAHAAMLRQRHIRAAQAVDLGVLYTSISAGMLLARRYLTGRGIDQELPDRYGSAFGRTAAKIYRSATGSEPRRAWSLVSGKWRRVNGYLPAETDVLDEAFTTYKRTAEYVVEAAPVEAEDGCRIPACVGTWHYDKTCVAGLAEVAFDGPDVALAAELSAPTTGGTPSLVAFIYNMSSLNTRREMRDRASAAEFSAQLRRLADAIDGASAFLPA